MNAATRRVATAPAPRKQSTLGAAVVAEQSEDGARAKSTTDLAVRSDRAVSRVLTGSGWDRKKGSRPKSQDTAGRTSVPTFSIVGLVDAFGSMNDPEAVAIFEEQARLDEMLAEERAAAMMQSRIAEVRAGMDTTRLPALLRRQLAVHPAAWKHFSRLRKRFPDLFVPPADVHDAIIELLPSTNSREVHRLLQIFEWPECGTPDKTGKIDVQSLFDKVPLKSPAQRQQRSPPQRSLMKTTTTAPAASTSPTASKGGAAATQRLQLKLGGKETDERRLPARDTSHLIDGKVPPSQRKVSNVLGVLGNEAGSLLVEGPVFGPPERCGAPAARLDLSGEGPQAQAASAQLGSRADEIGAKLLGQLRARHANVRDLFYALDANRDGQISLNEFGESLRKLGLRSPPAGYATLFAAFHAVAATAAPPTDGEQGAPLDFHSLQRKLHASSASPLRPLLPPPPPSDPEALFLSPNAISPPDISPPDSPRARPASPPTFRGCFDSLAPPLLTTPPRPVTASPLTRGSGQAARGPAIWVCGDPKRPHSAKPPLQHTLLRGRPRPDSPSRSTAQFTLPTAAPGVEPLSLPRRPSGANEQRGIAMPSAVPGPIALPSPAPRHQPLRASSSAPRLGSMRPIRLEAGVLPPPAEQRAGRGAASALLKKQLDLSWFEQETFAR